MSAFAYKAKKGPVDIVRGSVEAPSRLEAIKIIEAKGYIPIEVVLSAAGIIAETVEHKVKAPSAAARQPVSLFHQKVSPGDLSIFTNQLSSLLKSNVTLLRGVELIKNETPNRRLKAILEQVAAEMHNGSRFSEALAKFGSDGFDARYISMVRCGEAGGSLDAVFEALAGSIDKEEETKGQIRTAMAYPLLIVFVGGATLFFLFTYCVPRLSTLFAQATHLPLPTKILLTLSQPAWQIGLWVGLAVFTLAVSILFLGKGEQKRRRDIFLARLPLLGDIKLKADIARFCETLAMLIENGVSIFQSIEIARPVLSNELLMEELRGAQSRIMGGEMLSSVFKGLKFFPVFVVNMIAVGEESGTLPRSLREVARFYSRESLRGIKLVTSLIEPLFILGISLVVGFVVAGMMLPIFDLSWVK